jgi:hypothetical protein
MLSDINFQTYEAIMSLNERISKTNYVIVATGHNNPKCMVGLADKTILVVTETSRGKSESPKVIAYFENLQELNLFLKGIEYAKKKPT